MGGFVMSKKSLLVLVSVSLLVFSVLLYAQGTKRGQKLTVHVVPDRTVPADANLTGTTLNTIISRNAQEKEYHGQRRMADRFSTT